jgi:hypothetical protein
MRITIVRRVIFCALLCLTISGLSAQYALAQESQLPKRDDSTNLDLQLYVLVASNQPSLEGKVPATLDPVIKRLRETLPFKNYALSSTMMNRVKSGGNLSLKWIVGPLSSQSSMPTTPTFNEFSIGNLRIVTDPNGVQLIQMLQFRFGSRVPIQTSTNLSVSGTAAAATVNWEPVGLLTDISVRENEPAIVGTLNIGPSGDVIVLAVSARRAN